MLRTSEEELIRLDEDYPGIRETVARIEKAPLPGCPRCASKDTAQVQVGMVGRSLALAGATSRVKLTASGPKPDEFFCNACGAFF